MRYQRAAYRAHNPRWSWAPLSGEGAARHGGRFNPPGKAALYLSVDHRTAILEASQGFGLKFQPLTLVSYAVDCMDIDDLTTGKQRKALGVTPADLRCAWKLLAADGDPVPTWELAARLEAGGGAGVLIPSFAPGADSATVNLVLWVWGDRPPHAVTVIDDEQRLPRDASSWAPRRR